MFVSERRRHAATRRPVQKTDLNQIRFNNLFYRIFLLGNRRGNGAQPHGPAVEFLDDRQQQFSIHFIETVRVDFHAIQRVICDFLVDTSVVIHFSVVPHATQQTIDYTWRAPRATRNFTRAAVVDPHAEYFSRAFADNFQIFVRIEIQMKDYSEAPTQRSRDQAGASCGAHQRELGQLELYGTRGWTLSDQKIQLIVFHRRIKLLFQCGKQAMNLVDEEHVTFLKVGQQRCDVAGFLDRRTGRGFQLGAHFVRDDVGERRLTQTWWSSEQHVIECFAASARGFHVNAQVLFYLTLSDVLFDASGAQRQIELTIFVSGRAVF